MAAWAARSADFKAGFLDGSNRPSCSSVGSFSPVPSWQAAITACRFLAVMRDPATSAATFCSSTTFQFTYSSISGWSASTTTILAARRVVPPDFMAPAARSPIFKKLIKPEELPPPDSPSLSPRISEKLDPVPEPYLNSRASRTHKSIMPPSLTKSSATDWIKHA